ncbi:MAG: hypothetical protein GY719_25875 [bacterium]|nr:hypothetical protein [bacterium]
MGTLRDHESEITGESAIAPTRVAANGTTAGAIHDMAGHRSITWVITVGNYTDGTYTPVISESDDDGMSGENVVVDADLLPDGTGQEATAALAAAGVSKIGYRGPDRYVTCDLAATSVTTGADIAVVAVKEALDQPVA